MFSEAPRGRNRLSRTNLGPGHVSLPDPAATGGQIDQQTPNTECDIRTLHSPWGVARSAFGVFRNFARDRFKHAPDIFGQNFLTGGIWMDAVRLIEEWIA